MSPCVKDVSYFRCLPNIIQIFQMQSKGTGDKKNPAHVTYHKHLSDTNNFIIFADILNILFLPRMVIWGAV